MPNEKENLKGVDVAPLEKEQSKNHTIPVLSISEGAHKFLIQLKDAGLINEKMEEEVFNRLMISKTDKITMDDLKRMSAIVIFEHQFSGSNEYYGIFEEEWKLLFN